MFLKNSNNATCLFLRKQRKPEHLLWEIEGTCGMCCKYCYPSRTKQGRLSRERLDALIGMVNQSSIQYVHLTGGEPTRSPYLEHIVKHLKGKHLLITTNLVSNVALIRQLLTRYSIYSIAVSLDATDPNINDSLRGNTKIVLDNLGQLLQFREENRLATKIRIHCVISKANLNHIPDLLHWAKAAKIDEVSCQPISIEKDHPYYETLRLEARDMERIDRILQEEKSLFDSNYADTHRRLIRYYLENPDCYIEEPHDLCNRFIDARGELWNCPRKISKIKDFSGLTQVSGCRIIPQCMTCLKYLEITEDGNAIRKE